MNWLRRWSVVSVFAAVAAGFAAADGQTPSGMEAGREKWLVDRALAITPRAEPEPALRYRLFPVLAELKEGNAVPIYLRLNHEQNDEQRKYWMETPLKWNDLPLDQMPLAEAHKYLEREARFLQQLDYGARRKSADWNYTLDQPDPISILLPDAQWMRGYAPMLVLNARVKVAEGDFRAAAHSFATGFAFSRHVANGPFLINSLVGMNIANQIADRIPEWIERPGSPNLYWGLTVLPRPFIDLRKQMELEQQQVELQFPDLADLDRPRAAAEWDAALKRVRAEIKRIDPMVHLTSGLWAPGSSEAKRNNSAPQGNSTKNSKPVPLPDPDEPAAKSPDLAEARKFVAHRTGKPAAEVAAMPPAQVLLLYIHGTYADLRDDRFKITYLPFPAAHTRMAAADEQLKMAIGGEGVWLAKAWLPAVTKVMIAQNRLERRIALLRAIEALRIHAAANGGQLPESLEQVTIAPVPLDPGTGKPFEYRRNGTTATLASRLPGEPLESTGLRYRLTVR